VKTIGEDATTFAALYQEAPEGRRLIKEASSKAPKGK
jgi:hypothetical protein